MSGKLASQMVRGSRCIADASAIRIEVEPDFVLIDVATASPMSPKRHRWIGDAARSFDPHYSDP
eukprot:2060613-Pyramimonas_sp.AAC.1